MMEPISYLSEDMFLQDGCGNFQNTSGTMAAIMTLQNKNKAEQ
jgi:hypothetical protein